MDTGRLPDMTKRIKTVLILLSVVMIMIFAASIGMTLAIWTSTGAGLDNNTVAPATDSSMDWNMWAKYFDGVVINDVSHTAAVTAFHTDGYGLNLETVIIPTDVTVDGIPCKVVEIRSQAFADNILKQLPVTIYIPPTVTRICAATFANLPSLTRVVFGVDSEQTEPCVIEDYAFMMCASLVTVSTNGRQLVDASGAAISASGNQFMGSAPEFRIVTSL